MSSQLTMVEVQLEPEIIVSILRCKNVLTWGLRHATWRVKKVRQPTYRVLVDLMNTRHVGGNCWQRWAISQRLYLCMFGFSWALHRTCNAFVIMIRSSVSQVFTKCLHHAYWEVLFLLKKRISWSWYVVSHIYLYMSVSNSVQEVPSSGTMQRYSASAHRSKQFSVITLQSQCLSRFTRCHKNFKWIISIYIACTESHMYLRMKRNPRKVRWTKAFRKAAGKEMTIVRLLCGTSLLPYSLIIG